MARSRLTPITSNSILLLLAPAICSAQAQSSPVALAQAVVEQWSAGAETAFALVYPFRGGREALSASLSSKSRPAGLAKVIRADDRQAILLSQAFRCCRIPATQR